MVKEYPLSEYSVKIAIGNQTLAIVCSQCYDGLYSLFPNADDSMTEYVRNHTKEAFYKAIEIYDNNRFILNISPNEGFANLGLRGNRWLVERQTERFLPIIKMFLADGFQYDKYLEVMGI